MRWVSRTIRLGSIVPAGWLLSVGHVVWAVVVIVVATALSFAAETRSLRRGTRRVANPS